MHCRLPSASTALGALALLASLAARPALAQTKTTPVVPASGQILIAGGIFGPDFLPTGAAEIYDPATQTFTATVTMKPAREEALPLLVPAEAAPKVANRILILGGEKKAGKKFPHLRSTSAYDPATGKFKAGPGMKKPMEDGAVVALNDGRFLVLVGETTKGVDELASNQAMTFDPAKGKFSLLAAKLGVGRRNSGVAVINGCGCAGDGKVLIVGGRAAGGGELASAELFDPVTNSFAPTGDMNVAREGCSATALPDGTVLIAGGFDQPGDTTATAEIYDPGSGTFTLTSALFGGTGSDMDANRAFFTATLLPDGTVLLAGGEQDTFGGGDHTTSEASTYDPATGVFTPTANTMSDDRVDHSATLIVGTVLAGKVLIAGGETFDGINDALLTSADLYNPATRTFAPTGSLVTGRSEHVAVQIP